MAAEQTSLSEKAIFDHEKRKAILSACQGQDFESLVELADSKGGLLEDELRATSCKCRCYEAEWTDLENRANTPALSNKCG